MWCLKHRWKCQTGLVLGRRGDIQVLQYRKTVVCGHDELLQPRSMQPKVNMPHAITVLQCKHYSLFIFRGEVVILVIIINDEWKRRRMCQHVNNGCAMCTNEAKIQVGGRTEYEVPPSLTDLHELVPPAFAAPITIPGIAIFIPVEEAWSTERK
jgi:hypothetical protein